MPRTPAHTLDTAPDASRDTLSALGKHVGKILNIHAGMAHSPLVIEMYAAMSSSDSGDPHGSTFGLGTRCLCEVEIQPLTGVAPRPPLS